MIASRTALRSTRALRQVPKQVQRTRANARFQSTSTPPPPSGNAAVTGAIAGGLTTLIVGYGYYHYSGLKKLSNIASHVQQYMSSAQKKLVEQTPESNEAVRWLKQVSTYYAGFVPGAKGVVDSVWGDLEKVRGKHGNEFDKIVNEAYGELKGVIGKGEGMTMDGAAKAWRILTKHMEKLQGLVEDAAGDILENHPEIKKQLGGSYEQLKNMGDSLGPEAKKQVDQTWDQVKDISKSGFSADSITKIKKVVEEKVEVLKKMADEAWSKGMEKAQPYLEKNPQIKKIVEENKDALKQGNFQELYNKIEKAVKSGDTKELEDYAKGAGEKAKKAASSMGGGLDQYIKMIPGGAQLGEHFGKFQEVVQKRGPEAQKLAEETIKEIQDLLAKKSDEAEKIAEKAKKD
ncbi:hypothetical protein E2P81_ATG05975 [Venturia nashicola]|nr:hypothetical protein E2P81_ATG05975 [Venturia nashicola]